MINFPITIDSNWNVNGLEISDFKSICIYVQNLPYGRNANRYQPELVMKEAKGSCSSKHAFLKMVADKNEHPEVKLILGIFKMNHLNTPGIGNVLVDAKMDFMPEAHCYLKIGDDRFDFTNPESNISKIKKDILLEKEITPQQVAEFKVEFHQTFLKNWLKENETTYSFEEIWRIREDCIKALANA